MNISENFNINTQNLNTNNSNIMGNPGLNSGITGKPDISGNGISGELSANVQLAMLQEGQTFSGKILDITNNQVNILLNSNKTLTAKIADSIMFNIGDNVSFVVKEKSGNTMFLAQTDNVAKSSKDNAILKILESNNLSPSDKNYAIAENLMKQGMPVNRANMQKIMQQSLNFPEQPMSTLVSMNRMGLQVNEKTISQYNDLVSNNSKLMADIENFVASVSDSIFDGSGMDAGVILGALSDEADFANLRDFTGTENVDTAKTGTITETITDIKEYADKYNISDGILREFIEDADNLGTPAKDIKLLLEKSETPMQLVNNINELIKNSAITSELFTKHSFRRLLRDAVSSKLSLGEKDLDTPRKLDDLYKSISDKTQKLMQNLMDNSESNSGKMYEKAGNIRDRIDFINNLNNMFAYSQLPIKFRENEMNSELFVFMNKKSIKSPKEALSALLHLDMDNLGPTDVHVSLNGDIVSTKFYVEDEESARIIDEHMTMLEKALLTSGYKLNNQTINRQKEEKSSGNMVVQQLTGNEMEKSIKRFSFDMRT